MSRRLFDATEIPKKRKNQQPKEASSAEVENVERSEETLSSSAAPAAALQTSSFSSIHSSRFFAPVTDQQIQDEIDEEELQKRNKELEIQQTKSVVSSIQQAKAKKKNKSLDDGSSKENKEYKLVGTKRTDELISAFEAILRIVETQTNVNKVNEYFSNLQKCIAKYEKFYGEDSIGKFKDFLEFSVKFQKCIKEFEESKTKKNKDVSKKINALNVKLNKAFFIPLAKTIELYKTNPEQFNDIIGPSSNTDLQHSEGEISKPAESKNKQRTSKDSATNKSAKPIIEEEDMTIMQNAEKGEAKIEEISYDNSITHKETFDVAEDDAKSDEKESDNLEDVVEKNTEEDDITQMTRVGLDVALLDMEMDDILMNDALINFQTFFLKKNVLALTERMQNKKLKKSKPKKQSATPQNNPKAQIAENKLETQPLTLEEKYFNTKENLTSEAFMSKLEEFSLTNNTKNFNLKSTIGSLDDLLLISETNEILASVKMFLHLQIANTLLSGRVISGSETMQQDDFSKVIRMLHLVFEFINNSEDQIKISNSISREEMNLTDTSKPLLVSMSILQTICDTDIEFWNLLRSSHQSSTRNYIEILAYSKDIILICQKCIDYNNKEKILIPQEICSLYIRLMQHLYHLPPSLDQHFLSSNRIGEFNNFIRLNSASKIDKHRSTLYYIVYLSNRGRFQLAKQLLLISHISDSIEQKDIQTQILYNHALTSLGISAFRDGEFEFSHQFLSQLHCMNKSRELLGQNLNNARERTELRKLIDLKVQIPVHMEISPNVAEFAYLISALFSEFYNYILKLSSKQLNSGINFENTSQPNHFRHILSKIEKEYIFIGEPEKVIEHVYCLFVAILNHDYPKCSEIIRSQNLHDHVFIKIEYPEDIIEQIEAKCKEMCMISFVVNHQCILKSIKLEELAEDFDVGEYEIMMLIGKCIHENIVCAYIDMESLQIVFTESARDLMNLEERDNIKKFNLLCEKASAFLSNIENQTMMVDRNNIVE